jgi:Kef-type K+ transport system membrane component KefB
MFVAGLELDLQILEDYRRAAVGLGLPAFAIPGTLGLCVGLILGWSAGRCSCSARRCSPTRSR